MKIILPTILACAVLNSIVSVYAARSSNDELLARIKQGDNDSIIEAGKTGNETFIPMLEGIARPHFVAAINTNRLITTDPREMEGYKNAMAHPVYDEPVAINARMALAKLGVKEYLDEILLEATNPASSPVYKEKKQYPAFAPSRYTALVIQTKAFEKLRYIKDRSTVKVLISLLASKENTADYIVGGDVTFTPPSEMAMQTLPQIVDNPPQVNLPPDNETHDARVKIWQQWWEQNKDKYP